jgi:hypothetical protein
VDQQEHRRRSTLEGALAQLNEIDIERELLHHDALHARNELVRCSVKLTKHKAGCMPRRPVKLIKNLDKLKKEIEKLEKHECYACGQAIHDNKHESTWKKNVQQCKIQVYSILHQRHNLQEHVDTLAELGEPATIPAVFYDTKEDAINHRNSIANIKQQIATKRSDQDPYAEQIREMETQAVEEVNYDMINELSNVKDHQDFLLKLLTNKDSFIRKRIIDQNLSYLNARLGQYLDRIGLPHTVKFLNDLTVSIEELGRELDFDNLSRGERNRLYYR